MPSASSFATLAPSASTDLIRDLAGVGPGDAALAGRKAFHLATLMRHGFDVPQGFCVTTEAFRQCRAACRGELVLPPPLREAIVAAWRRAGLRVAAVRSSASEEDGREASWAGVFPTVLPVSGEEELLAAVEACFQALHAPEAEHYRRSCKRGHQPPAMAVLVQSLVDARAAGVMFTANPVSGARNEIVINAVPGLGEPLASGRVSGDVFVVCRAGSVKSASVSAKPFMLTREGEVALAPAQAERRAVTEDEVAALARLAVRVEAVFGCPQDIEFAIGGGRIHVLQARPVTGPAEGMAIGAGEAGRYLDFERARLKCRVDALRRQGKLRGSDVIFSNGNVGELLPTPAPMSFGLFRTIFAGRGGAITAGRRMLGYHLDEDATGELYELICGQPYFNVEIDAGTFNIGLPSGIDSILASIAGQPDRANYPEFGLYCQGLSLADAVARYGADGPRHHAVIRRFHTAITRTAHAVRRRYPAEIEPLLRRSLEPARPSEICASNAELLAAFQRRLDHLQQFACVWFVVAARLAFYFADMVRWRLEQHLGDSKLAAPLFQGLDGSLITAQALDLENLAQGRITRDAFLRTYGHSSANELEISLVRLAEDPQAIERLLHDLAVSGRRPAGEFHEQQRRRRALQRELRGRLAAAGTSAAGMRALFADLRLAQTFLPLRETIKHYYTGEYRALREILLEINRRLGWEDGDIFYLEPEEIPGCFRSREALVPLVRHRRRERRIAALLAAQRRLPAVIFASGLQAIGARPQGPQSRHLTGMPVAPGSAVGVVRLLGDADIQPPAWKEMRGEEIIVARSANLGLAPLLRVAAGLIVEVGGVLAHAACQARESGIPAVVLAGAACILREGMTVSIDGDTGRIEILSEEAAAP